MARGMLFLRHPRAPGKLRKANRRWVQKRLKFKNQKTEEVQNGRNHADNGFSDWDVVVPLCGVRRSGSDSSRVSGVRVLTVCGGNSPVLQLWWQEFSGSRNLRRIPAHPGGAQCVQDQAVGEREFLGVQDNFVGVVDQRISGDAPGLMPNDAGAVLASDGLAIFVAVKDNARAVQDHGDLDSCNSFLRGLGRSF